MCSMSVICPLCAVPSFANLEQLQQCLIKAANGPLSCPFEKCQEQFLGLDKLTIHLFTHTTLMTSTNETNVGQQQSQLKIKQQQQQLLQPTPAMGAIKNLGKRKANKKCITNQQDTIATTPSNNLTSTSSLINNNNNNNNNINVSAAAALETSLSLVACDICEFTFRNVELRDMHFRLVHENFENSLASSICDNTTSKGTAASATKSKFEPFKCHLCAKTFKMKGSLRLHLKVMHMMGLPYMNANSTKLNICDRIRYKETSSLKQHHPQQQQHLQHDANKLYDGASLSMPISQDLQAVDTKSNLLIDYNSKGLAPIPTPPSSSSSTTTTATTTLCSLNDSSEYKDSFTNCNIMPVTSGASVCEINPKIWECDVCSKSFTTKYFLKKHKRLHTGEMPYTCEICARTFTFQQSYHKHLLYHSEVKPHICNVCGRAFKELSTLHNHERIHSGEKPFKCEVCGKCFRQRVSFLVHTRIHTGVMPYKCNQCQKSFRYKVSQRTHKCLESITTESATSLLNDNNKANELRDSVEKHPTSAHFIKTLLDANASSTSHNNVNAILSESQQSPASVEIANITDMIQISKSNSDSENKNALEEALLTKAIDDIVIESCQKLGIDYANDAPTITATRKPSPTESITRQQEALKTVAPVGVSYINEDTNSSLEKLESLRLYSPLSQLVPESNNETIVMFDQFLLD